jgi:hypothetical protein
MCPNVPRSGASWPTLDPTLVRSAGRSLLTSDLQSRGCAGDAAGCACTATRPAPAAGGRSAARSSRPRPGSRASRAFCSWKRCGMAKTRLLIPERRAVILHGDHAVLQEVLAHVPAMSAVLADLADCLWDEHSADLSVPGQATRACALPWRGQATSTCCRHGRGVTGRCRCRLPSGSAPCGCRRTRFLRRPRSPWPGGLAPPGLLPFRPRAARRAGSLRALPR